MSKSVEDFINSNLAEMEKEKEAEKKAERDRILLNAGIFDTYVSKNPKEGYSFNYDKGTYVKNAPAEVTDEQFEQIKKILEWKNKKSKNQPIPEKKKITQNKTAKPNNDNPVADEIRYDEKNTLYVPNTTLNNIYKFVRWHYIIIGLIMGIVGIYCVTKSTDSLFTALILLGFAVLESILTTLWDIFKCFFGLLYDVKAVRSILERKKDK